MLMAQPGYGPPPPQGMMPPGAPGSQMQQMQSMPPNMVHPGAMGGPQPPPTSMPNQMGLGGPPQAQMSVNPQQQQQLIGGPPTNQIPTTQAGYQQQQQQPPPGYGPPPVGYHPGQPYATPHPSQGLPPPGSFESLNMQSEFSRFQFVLFGCFLIKHVSK